MLAPLEQLKYAMHQHGVFFGRVETDDEHDECIFADLTQVCEFLRLSECDLSDLFRWGDVPYTLCIAAGAPRLIIAEDDLWCLALYSPHPLAQQWRRWLLSQMLPRYEPTADMIRPEAPSLDSVWCEGTPTTHRFHYGEI